MVKDIVQTGELKFSIDSNILFELGERLVSKPSIALSELVKNAYDADATKVTVTFDKVNEPSGRIFIEDNGHGMTFEEVENNWMRIATGRKRERPFSKIHCRPVTGSKGIGRLATQRLGTKLVLQTVAERDDNGIPTKESVVVDFDWKEEFSPGQDLVRVPVLYKRQAVPLETQTGVVLFIEGVKDVWTEDEVIKLRRDLLSIQNPYPDLTVQTKRTDEDYCEPDPGFSFELVIDGSEELSQFSGELGESFLKAAWAKLEGEIDDKGIAHYKIDVRTTKEKDKLIDESNIYHDIEGANFRIYFFIYKKDLLEGTGWNQRNAAKKGREEGGVRIYLDGFRVFPYGDSSDDWLRLDEFGVKNIDLGKVITPVEEVKELASSLARPFLLVPKNNQLFGAVLISQVGHSGIEMNVTRDRLIQTQAFEDLRRFVQSGIYWMTIKYAAFLAEQRASQKREQEAEAQKKGLTRSVLDIIEDVKVVVANQTEIPEERRFALLQNLNIAHEQIKIKEEARISEISMLRILASAGTTIVLMNHQLQAIVGAVLQIHQDLLRLRSSIPESLHRQYDDITKQVADWHEMVESQVLMLGFLLAPDNRQTRRRHLFYHIIEDVKKPLSFYMKTYHVSFENNVPPTLRTPPIYKAELYAILINILSNALKAIYGQAERRVSIGAKKVGNELHFWMMDTGVGVPIERREIVFKPFQSTSLPNPVLGVGTGLGLMVVKDMLEAYGGIAQFVDVESPWKTRIEVILPER